MFQKVDEPDFVVGEHAMLRFWEAQDVFRKLQAQNAQGEHWSFLDGPITANNPMGVHHAWGRTYKDAFQRYRAMTGRKLRYQNGFDCQGLWVEVEVEKELNLGTKTGIADYGIDRFVRECKKRVLKFAARQTEQSVRLGYWMEWDDAGELRKLSEAIGEESRESRDESREKGQGGRAKSQVAGASEDRPSAISYRTARGQTVTEPAEQIAAKLGNPEWGGSYFTFSTENNETIWSFLKKCFERKKIYQGHDVMPWSGRAGSAYSQMEVADGRKLTTHRSCFVRFRVQGPGSSDGQGLRAKGQGEANAAALPLTLDPGPSTSSEYLLVWTTTPWTLTSNVACAVNPELEYVKLRAKRDGALYYFAKDNLEFKRLEKEFKEGFGRPEWSWPEGVGKLKSIAQIFKEQGGYEIEGTVFGREMVGWRYEGPFDELSAQEESAKPQASDGSGVGDGIRLLAHVVIDGGRDSKGSATVVAGEGTGIVHIAPGCGDVDHQIGKQLGLPIIAPLGEDGTFGEGFGDFTGRRATDPDTAQMVFDSLKEKGLLVAVETYPHIYPFCWRTGDELVFRLVDEWFINMDWREEIKEVVDTIEWLPPSIEGREREREWLTNMRDWMISKKRFWGLALPIWVNPDDPTDFEVMGSLAELKERALEFDRSEGVDGLSLMVDGQEGATQSRDALAEPVAPGDQPLLGTAGRASSGTPKPRPSGWDRFEGHTPHRPWIDGVKIKSRKTGAVLSRIVDVGNPWLDAGIVPFSTLNYGEWKRGQGTGEGAKPQASDESRETGGAKPQASGGGELRWEEWYPPEFVVECFPGQFRNWFYSLLALSTMMRYDETDVPAEKRPFKTLLGHRLVMNEEGKPMHKSDGTAIWFEEAAEQLGVDTLRWLYLAQDPASDLRFGTRHKDEPVTLPTVDGPLTHTREGLPCCKVTSKPADEVRRQVLIPLWNSYAFFVNYARLDGFDPALPAVPVSERPEIDRWILSNLQSLLKTANERFCAYDTAAVCRASATFIDDLSNWYIRRNRRRFWRSRKEGSGFGIQDSGKGQGGRGKGQGADPGSDSAQLAGAAWDQDKLAAYQTLYEVLVTLTKTLAPVAPFVCERMYGNLVFGDRLSVVGQGGRAKGQGAEALGSLPLALDPQPSASSHREPTTDNRQPVSVHLCAYPQGDESLIDAGLSARMATAQRVVSMGLRLRDAKDLRVRQPLAELRYAATDELAAQIAALEDVIDDELNVKLLRRVDNLDDLVRYTYKPNLKTLGPKYGKLLNALRTKIPELGDAALRPLRGGQGVTVTIDGTEVALAPEDVMVATEQAGEWSTADEPGLQIALSTVLTPELVQEGMARDFVRHVQQARKDAGLEITDRIRVWYSGSDEVSAAVGAWGEYIARETLADGVEHAPTASAEGKSVSIGEVEGWVWIERG